MARDVKPNGTVCCIKKANQLCVERCIILTMPPCYQASKQRCQKDINYNTLKDNADSRIF
jgi:hypothetical protein